MRDTWRRLILRARAPLFFVAVIALLIFIASKRTAPRPPPEDFSGMTPPPPDSNARATARIAAIIETHAARLMAIPGVHGVAEGRTADGRPCLLVLVEDPDSPSLAGIPREFDGVPVRFDRTDSIRADFDPKHNL